MINNLIRFSIHNRFFVLLLALALGIAGVYNAFLLPIDAVPDVTNKQVQINTIAPALAPAEVERQITFPIEIALAGMPGLQETRSISQFGLSQVTVIFEDSKDIYFARQLIAERLGGIREELPPGASAPQMGPVSTGLGEILNVVVTGKGDLMEKREMLDFVVKPQLRTVPGLSEVNSFGGYEKQFQVVVNPQKLQARNLHLRDVSDALEKNNSNAGGGYLRKGDEQQLVRGIGAIQNASDIGNIVLKSEDGIPVLIRDVADVTTGGGIRQGALTSNGKGEAVMGITMLLLGENGRVVVERVKDRMVSIQKTLPAGTKLVPFLDRSELIGRTLQTAIRNLAEGGLLVVGVLFLFLLQLRAGLIVSSVIPLSMLFAIIGMRYFGVSANLMSLGAVDFGLIVDAAVIIVENCVRRLAEQRTHLGRDLTEDERRQEITDGAIEVRQASQFGEIIIIAAYLPILSLVGIEGKMFRPMGITVILALIGALLLSVTLIPALCAYFLRVKQEKESPIIRVASKGYAPSLNWALDHRGWMVGGATVFFVACASLFPRLGSEFLPQLNEGAIAIGAGYPPSMSIETATKRSTALEKALLKALPNEIDTIVTRIGRAEIATDPMLPSQHDILISLKPQEQWKGAHDHEELVAKMSKVLEEMPGVGGSFSQPIQFRMNELIEGIGIRSELGIKIFGDDMTVLASKADEIARAVRSVQGAADVSVEETEGLPVLNITLDRAAIARYGINVSDVQDTIESAVGGKDAGDVIQGNRRFEISVRLAESYRRDPEAIGRITVESPTGANIPLSQLANIESTQGPVQISRENGQRRVVIQSNVRGRDLGSFVDEVRREIDAKVKLPVGYHVEFGGTYEHLQSGRARLMIVVPLTFGLIFLLLFTTFGNAKQAMLVFTGIPFAITGGILALYGRGMPFSMSAGVGFIALFGVAVLNGVVLVMFINELREKGTALREAVVRGCLLRLRPVLMTAAVASIGFLPMAFGHGAGAEVQRPLATVVIGGLLTSTLLTLFVLPTLYLWFEGKSSRSV
ncbi:efflux RND transporter permease subunit [bacterium]|nr:MAG: efflux RND transporter permease subunit [bacterium]